MKTTLSKVLGTTFSSNILIKGFELKLYIGDDLLPTHTFVQGDRYPDDIAPYLFKEVSWFNIDIENNDLIVEIGLK